MRRYFHSQMYDEVGRKAVRLQKLILFLMVFQILGIFFSGFSGLLSSMIYFPILLVGFIGAAKRRPCMLRAYWIAHFVIAIFTVIFVIIGFAAFNRFSHNVCKDAPEGTVSRAYVVWSENSNMFDVFPFETPEANVPEYNSEEPVESGTVLPEDIKPVFPYATPFTIPSATDDVKPFLKIEPTSLPKTFYSLLIRDKLRDHKKSNYRHESTTENKENEAQLCYEVEENDRHCSTEYTKSRYIGQCVEGNLKIGQDVEIHPVALLFICFFVAAILVVKIYSIVLSMRLPGLIKCQRSSSTEAPETYYPQQFIYVPVPQEQHENFTYVPQPSNNVLSDEELARQLQAQYDREL